MNELKFPGEDLGLAMFLRAGEASSVEPDDNDLSKKKARAGDKWKQGLEKCRTSLGSAFRIEQKYFFFSHIALFSGLNFLFLVPTTQSMLSLPIAQAKIQQNMKRLKALTEALKLTEREFALLSVAVTEMCAAGLDPYSEQFVIQVAPRSGL